MTEDNGIKEEVKTGELTIYNVPVENIKTFIEITRFYGKKGHVAFQAMLDAYFTVQMLGEMQNRLTLVEEQLKVLQSGIKEEVKVKTFGK